MRVLHYLDAVRLEAGGVVRCVLDMCSAVAAQGVPVTLATLDARDIPTVWQAAHGIYPQAVRLSAVTRQEIDHLVADADVVHLHTPWDRRNTVVAAACRAHRKPYIVSAHGMLDDWSMSQKAFKKRLYWWLAARKLLEGAAVVHATAEGEARQAQKWYPRGKSVVLPLVVDMPSPDSLPGPGLAEQKFACLETRLPKLLFLSRLHPKKGVETLIAAVDLLRQRGLPTQTLLAGPGDESYVQQLRAEVTKRGLADLVHFVGMVSGDLKWSLYQACDVFVLPTQQENFGLVLPEALACGTPVVTTTGVDIWPELEAAGGRIVPPRDAYALAEALSQLLRKCDQLPALGERGRQYVAHWLATDRVAAEFVSLYSRAAHGDASSPV